ncbi:MAG: CGGC domain-containing protein [Firmicutes bacterium]|nr:CGGC domain-containing protein [Bacillota bacterium]
MARIGILTCSNCTQELDCASVVCLGDMRKMRGFFERYKSEKELTLVGMISCAGCPTVAAPQKILKRVGALAAFRVDAIHLSYCMTALCPFKNKYIEVIKEAYPGIEIVEGTHVAHDFGEFRKDVREVLCAGRENMTDIIKGRK